MIPACFFFFCWFGPSAVVPDGAGGYVPFTNSRVMPDGSLRPYDPALDGIPTTSPDGPYPYIVPMPGALTDFPVVEGPPPPPPDYADRGGYEPPEQASPPNVSNSSPRHHRPAQAAHQPCYDANGTFVGGDYKECR
jgi:hypothetical protein